MVGHSEHNTYYFLANRPLHSLPGFSSSMSDFFNSWYGQASLTSFSYWFHYFSISLLYFSELIILTIVFDFLMPGSLPFHSEKMTPTLLHELAARTKQNAVHIWNVAMEKCYRQILFL